MDFSMLGKVDTMILTNTVYEYEELAKEFDSCPICIGQLGQDTEQGMIFRFYMTEVLVFALVWGYKGSQSPEGVRIIRVMNKTAQIINTGTTGALREADIFLVDNAVVKVPLDAPITEKIEVCTYCEGDNLEQSCS